MLRNILHYIKFPFIAATYLVYLAFKELSIPVRKWVRRKWGRL